MLLLHSQIAYALTCTNLFSDSKQVHDVTQHSSAVWFTIPEKIIQSKGLETHTTLKTLEPLLNQLSFSINADLKLPDTLTAGSMQTHKQIEIDLDVSNLNAQSGQIVGKLDASLKKASHPNDATHDKNFENRSIEPFDKYIPNETFNSMVAVKLSLLNEAIQNSLGDLKANPLSVDLDGVRYRIEHAPRILPRSYHDHVNNIIRVESSITVPLKSVTRLAGLAFKGDITVRVIANAQFIVHSNNTVSIKLLAIEKDHYSIDSETQRFQSELIKSAIHKLAIMEINKFNKRLLREPYTVDNLLSLPQSVLGTDVKLTQIILDNDGYIKTQLLIENKNADQEKAKIQISIKNRQ